MEGDKKSNGTLVGAVIIIIILVVGGIYTWQTKVKNLKEKAAQQEDTINNAANELNTLESDLKNTDTNLNVDIKKIQ